MTSEPGCDRCRESSERGYSFCLWCGRDIRTGRMDNGTGNVIFQCGLLIMAVCAVILLIELSVALYMGPEVFDILSGYSNGIVVLAPMPTVLFRISGVALQSYYLFLLVAVAVSVAVLIWKAVAPMKRFIADGDRDSIRNTALFEMPALFASVYVIQLALIMFMLALGSDVTSPITGMDELELAFLLLEASVWEEIVTRLLLIGVPMLAIALIVRCGNVRNELDPETRWWRYLTGGFGISRTAVVFILFSAVIFGIAHLSSWDLWKFFPSFIVGLAMGYLFVKYGLYASIGMHFLTDYLSSLDWVMTDGSALITLPLLLLALLGLPYVWVYLKRGLGYIRDAVTPP